MMRSLVERLFFGATARTNSRLARSWMPHYPYMFEPGQLALMVQCLDKTTDVAGCILEVGCMRGRTTVFLNRHLDSLKSTKRYFAIDTFAGFQPKDVEYEVKTRGKDATFDWSGFSNNKKAWFDQAMQNNHIARVQSIQADVNEFDFSCVGPDGVSFCLVDVDLYQPVKSALAKIYPKMSPGGVIVVDDCQAGSIYDGALDAYREFVMAHGLPERIEQAKIGLIEKA
jgi:O-methyltransferase